MITKKSSIVLGVIAVLVLSGLSFIFFFTKPINPSLIFVSQCNVSKELIVIKGGFTDSATRYRGYKVTYSDHALYIKVKGSKIPFAGSSGDIDISMKNNFGDIQKIYLESSNPSKKTLIWPNQR